MPGCLLAIFIGFVFIILSFALNLLRLFFGFKNAASQFMGRQTSQQRAGTFTNERPDASTSDTYSKNTSEKEENHRDRNGRFFEHDEGEYVDYEEIKD